jgi:hypothetical protein
MAAIVGVAAAALWRPDPAVELVDALGRPSLL